MRILTLQLAALLAFTAGTMAQDAEGAATPAAPRHDLRIAPKVGQPVLVSLDTKVRSSLTVLRDGKKIGEQKESTTIAIRAVDEYAKLEDGDCRMSRTYLQWQEDSDGRPRDPPLAGVKVDFHDQGPGRVSLTVADGRPVPKKVLDEILGQGSGVGPWVPLPKEASAGATFTVPFGALAPFLHGSKTHTFARAEAALTLQQVDPATGKATLTGILECHWEENEGDEATIGFESTGRLALEIDSKEGRLLALAYEPKLKGAGKVKGSDVAVEATATVALKTAVGPAVEAALKAPPRYRECELEAPNHGLTVKLPSHWCYTGDVQGTEVFGTWVAGGGEKWVIEVIGGDSGPDDKAFLKGVKEKILADVSDATSKPVKSRAGPGLSFAFVRDGTAVNVAVVVEKGRFARLRLVCPEASLKDATRDFEKALSSLQRKR